ncbi:MAG: hypothetical protein H6577_18145 [Lewinellaceae bacterium]|nr:hypothetical protein [Saprospiraceae bacterium]MCB9340047.1 hypothetical protein [Lewinellaceae bacterium]
MKIELPFKKDAGKLDNQTFFNSLGRAEAPAIRLLAKKISYGVRQAAALASLQP